MNAKLFDPEPKTVADLLKRLGNVSPRRVRWHPTPGTATEKDVLQAGRLTGRLCELVNGTLVEKAMGDEESFLTVWLGMTVNLFVIAQNLGWMTDAQGMYRLFSGTVRMPDLAFVSWGRCPRRRRPRDPISAIVPDLAIEVLSRSNTRAEMALKRQEYFTAGVRLVWMVDPRRRTVQVYTAANQYTTLDATDTLTGDPVLSGFTLPLQDLFAELDRHG